MIMKFIYVKMKRLICIRRFILTTMNVRSKLFTRLQTHEYSKVVQHRVWLDAVTQSNIFAVAGDAYVFASARSHLGYCFRFLRGSVTFYIPFHKYINRLPDEQIWFLAEGHLQFYWITRTRQCKNNTIKNKNEIIPQILYIIIIKAIIRSTKNWQFVTIINNSP